MCPYFNRMDKLVREKPNVQPAGTLELGAVSTIRTDSPEPDQSAEMEAAGDTEAADRSLQSSSRQEWLFVMIRRVGVQNRMHFPTTTAMKLDQRVKIN
ncbi:hypothetical protein DVH05_003057 [Phytophthora capsici]|nr:hypothetical protein DVH05_003057 [Phytophthora capsici]